MAGRRVDRRYFVSPFHLCSTGGYGKACTGSPSSFESERPQNLLNEFCNHVSKSFKNHAVYF